MITERIATWLAGLHREGVPAQVSQSLRWLALDTFGAALAGRDFEWAVAIRRWAEAGGGVAVGGATLWGGGARQLRAADAALVNGAAVHSLELDDFHNAKVHPGAVILPVVFALAQSSPASADRIDTAIAAGYEVLIRSSLALRPAAARQRGWHLTAVCGPLGAAAAASIMLGLDAKQTSWALGLAGTQSGGLFAFTADGADSKRFHPGKAAHAGVMAAELAQLGLSGPTQIYEALDGGLLKAFSDDPDPSQLTHDLGRHWHAAQTNFKPYGCCGSAHAHVDAALELRPHWLQGGKVRVGVAGLIDLQCGYEYVPSTMLNAQMSLRYAVAVALLEGGVLPAQFDEEHLRRPDIIALASALEVVHDPEHDTLYPANFCGWVEVETGPGVLKRVDVLNPSGASGHPQRESAIKSKFLALVAPELGEARAQEICAAFASPGPLPATRILALADQVSR